MALEEHIDGAHASLYACGGVVEILHEYVTELTHERREARKGIRLCFLHWEELPERGNAAVGRFLAYVSFLILILLLLLRYFRCGFFLHTPFAVFALSCRRAFVVSHSTHCASLLRRRLGRQDEVQRAEKLVHTLNVSHAGIEFGEDEQHSLQSFVALWALVLVEIELVREANGEQMKIFEGTME